MVEPLFTARELRRDYGRGPSSVPALDGIDLDVFPGQRLGIVGESGSGKSTLVRLLAALDRPTAGRITFLGRRIELLTERELSFLRSQVQMVFQDPRSSLNPRMRVSSIVTEALRSTRLDSHTAGAEARDRRLREVMEAVDLPYEMAERYPHEFSGGQRQRIAIARALAPRPTVLIADEPVSALDVSVRAQVLNLLSDLVAKHGLTLLFVSHDLTVVRHLCDWVLVMRRGRIVERGPIAAVFDEPQSDYTRELVAAVPKIRLTGG